MVRTSSRSLTRRTGKCYEVARAFFVLGERVGLDWLEHRLETLPVGTQWQRWAAQSMEDDLFLVRRQLVEKVIAGASGMSVDEAIGAFFERRAEAEARLERFTKNLAVEGVTDLAAIHGGAPAGPHPSRVTGSRSSPGLFSRRPARSPSRSR